MITVNIDKAKIVAHEHRRNARAVEFAPLDIKATIPSEAVAVEAARQAIREKYAVIQSNIDSATEVTTLKSILETLQY
jgi:hypothetical protein